MPSPTVGSDFLYLNRAEVIGTGLTDAEVLELTRAGLVEHAHGRSEMPAKIGIHPLPDTLIHAMPAHIPALHACGLKWSASFPENVRRGLDQTIGLIVLNDEQTGFPIAVMDSAWITARRTAAVSALATERLAPEGATTLTIIGCGVQGQAHLEMLPRVLPDLREIRLVDTRRGLAEKLAEVHSASPCAVAAHTDVASAVRDAGVVVSATAILAKPAPFIEDAWIEGPMLALPVDFDSAWQYRTFARASKFVVDSIAEMDYFHEVGYLPDGLPPIHAEIGEVVAGLKAGREPTDELIVDMNIGMAVEDMPVAARVLERAIDGDAGRLLPI